MLRKEKSERNLKSTIFNLIAVLLGITLISCSTYNRSAKSALASLNSGKYDEAISLYDKVLGKNPGYATAKQNLELILTEMPQKNNGIIQKQTSLLEENNSGVSEPLKKYEQIKISGFAYSQ